MNMKRFTARTPREALAMVKAEFGDDAVVMSTKPCADGVEVLAMAPESLAQIERMGAAQAAAPKAIPSAPANKIVQKSPAATMPATARASERIEPVLDSSVEQDVAQMAMSTLSFQDYVRERMLKRRKAEMAEAEKDAQAEQALPVAPQRVTPIRTAVSSVAPAASVSARRAAPEPAPQLDSPAAASASHRSPPVLRDEIRVERRDVPAIAPMLFDANSPREQNKMMNELRSMRGLIEQRFGALAFMEKLQRQPRHATMTQKLLECGFSPALIRRLADSLPAEGDPLAWAAAALERNLATQEQQTSIEDSGGIYALIGATGVGKTTSTAKLAAAFATRHGAAHLGLITLDAYRVGAHEQLRTYGRILGVPVHTAHDRASLEDLLDLLSAKKLILIDTAGMAQRDSRTRELLDMLSHASVKRLLVMNASAQGETFEDVVSAYNAPGCAGVILSKIDEAVKLGPALDVLIRHKLAVVAVGNGQRVPEDWHRLSANALVQRALRSQAAPAWRFDAGDMNLVFAGVAHPQPRTVSHSAAPVFAR